MPCRHNLHLVKCVLLPISPHIQGRDLFVFLALARNTSTISPHTQGRDNYMGISNSYGINLSAYTGERQTKGLIGMASDQSLRIHRGETFILPLFTLLFDNLSTYTWDRRGRLSSVVAAYQSIHIYMGQTLTAYVKIPRRTISPHIHGTDT